MDFPKCFEYNKKGEDTSGYSPFFVEKTRNFLGGKDMGRMIFETHAHYDDAAFDTDRDALLNSLRGNGIGTVINVSAELSGWSRTLELTEQYPFVYGALGVHPDDVGSLSEESIRKLIRLCKREKIVAVGEIGLDYYWNKENRETQRYWFAKQLEAARETGLPVIVHSREAASDTLETMRDLHAEKIGGVVHCFSYGKEMAREFLNMDLYLGIGGVVTFKNARKLKEVVEEAPLERLLLETDSPYLAPVPYRGKRNSSRNLPYIAEEIARLKHTDTDTVIRITEENARRLFGI